MRSNAKDHGSAISVKSSKMNDCFYHSLVFFNLPIIINTFHNSTQTPYSPFSAVFLPHLSLNMYSTISPTVFLLHCERVGMYVNCHVQFLWVCVSHPSPVYLRLTYPCLSLSPSSTMLFSFHFTCNLKYPP